MSNYRDIENMKDQFVYMSGLAGERSAKVAELEQQLASMQAQLAEAVELLSNIAYGGFVSSHGIRFKGIDDFLAKYNQEHQS